jgi:serine/threonine protein kinase
MAEHDEAQERTPIGETLGIARTLQASGSATRSGDPARDPTPLVRGSAAPWRYDARAHLGSGGMGVVDAVWDADLMREVAVKRLRPELRDDAGLLSQFLWEARVTAHLDHPNILPIHDLALGERGTLFFTMKRVHGRSLEDALRSARREEVGSLASTSDCAYSCRCVTRSPSRMGAVCSTVTSSPRT